MVVPFKNGHDPRAQSIHGGHIAFNRVRRLIGEVMERKLTHERLHQTGGPRTGDLAANAPFTGRPGWFERGGTEDDVDPRRSIWDECGYPSTRFMTPQRYQSLFDRDAIAKRVVEFMAKEAWQVPPEVFERQQGKVTTASERGLRDVNNQLRAGGLQDYFDEEEGGPLWEVAMRANVLRGVGRFGLIVFGLNDTEGWDKPVPGIVEEGSNPGQAVLDGKGRPVINEEDGQPRMKADQPNRRYELIRNAAMTSGRKLLYVNAFSESLVYVTKWETNEWSPRFGQPVEYNVRLNDPKNIISGLGLPSQNKNVHWTRCLHTCDVVHQAGSSPVFAAPLCQNPLNHILALQKVYGGSAEGYWKTVLPLLFFETHPQLGGDVDVDDEALKDMIEDMMNGLQRAGVLTGMGAKTAGGSSADPNPVKQAHLEAICIGNGWPMRLFMGSQTGGLGSTGPAENDSMEHDGRVQHYQRYSVTPSIVRPMVNRLVVFGCVPAPARSLDADKQTGGFKCHWPDVTKMSASQKAAVTAQRTAAMAQASQGVIDQVLSLFDYLVDEMDYTEEEAMVRIQNLQSDQADANGPEDGPQDLIGQQSEEWEPPQDEEMDDPFQPDLGGEAQLQGVGNEWTPEARAKYAVEREKKGGEHALEETGHDAHTAHVGMELIHGDLGHAARAYSNKVSSHALAAIAKSPGRLGKIAGKLADAHTALNKHADAALSKLKERYGAATTSAIIGASMVAVPGGSVASAFPGGKLVASLPGLALAEAGHRMGLVGPDSKLEAGMTKVAGFVHGVRSAIGRGVEAVRSGAEGVVRGALGNNGLAINAPGDSCTSPAEIERLSSELRADLAGMLEGVDLSGVGELMPSEDDDRSQQTVDEVHEVAEDELLDDPTDNARMCWGKPCPDGSDAPGPHEAVTEHVTRIREAAGERNKNQHTPEFKAKMSEEVAAARGKLDAMEPHAKTKAAKKDLQDARDRLGAFARVYV